MKVKVPSSVDVKQLVSEHFPTPTTQRNMKYRIYYFLSLVTNDNDNYVLTEDNDGYHRICSRLIYKILGARNCQAMIRFLLENEIIESNESYRNAENKEESECLGYRLNPKFNTGEFVYKTLPSKYFDDKIKKYDPNRQLKLDTNKKYQFLLDQFKDNHLQFHKDVFEFIYNLGNELLNKIEDENEYQRCAVLNLIGRWLEQVEKINSGDIWYNVSINNHRLNSTFSNLHRIFRPFLLCNGEPLFNVDISASQPYILSTILNDEFFSNKSAGYNLNTIYPSIIKSLRNNIDNTNNTGSTFNYYSNNTYKRNKDDKSSYPYMWRSFFKTQSDITNIEYFKKSPFEKDFYTYAVISYKIYNGQDPTCSVKERNDFKKSMMYILFQQKKGHRYNDAEIGKFRYIFPAVNKWIEDTQSLIGSSKFSYLMQRTESYLVLDKVCREFNELYPSVPLFTIHDGVYTTKDYIVKLESYMRFKMEEITGVKCGLKREVPVIRKRPTQDEIEDHWEFIKDINSKKKYDAATHKIFSSNIKRAEKFMNNYKS